ncbi:type I-C CRISPR-associated protein Cas8c/Csd1 [Peptoniphilus equinus]|uniref:Type I-C CRISPR-associated protein Cas8c/Csd1 n=1 Tax=Peptoniphilus equinus TaxID=3016343 RepID=A0ABY7QT03_9FIRM|nr:type I-C CRISPR-associated protein Cas8c/Csd1 [Peptoniphilus equinus]WBW49926.1 type I-C CRISPR-associated protein Cas8c/Csd1 [Peptoniphilus equinus]
MSMLIQGLVNYYDILAEEGKFAKTGYANVPIDYLVVLDPDGKMVGLTEHTKMAMVGKKEKAVPKTLVMPKRHDIPGIHANILEHRALYIFGLNFEDGRLTPEDRTHKAVKSHEAFVATTLAFIEGMDSPLINAFRQFVLNWCPEEETDNPHLLPLGKTISLKRFSFILNASSAKPISDETLIREKYEAMLKAGKGTSQVQGICAVTGEVDEIARLHTKIKGMKGGQSSGQTLVSFNNPSESSYGLTQSFNSSIGVRAMEAYTETLNYLLSDAAHHCAFGDTTLIFWSEGPGDRPETLLSEAMFFADDDRDLNMELTELMKDVSSTTVIAERLDARTIDPDIPFYIVGLKPNATRISVKFIHRSEYAKLMFNIAKHQNDVNIIGNGDQPLPLFWLMKQLERQETTKSSGTKKEDGAMTAKILEAIITGTPYPAKMLKILIHRVRIDPYFRWQRAGMIKACINRNVAKEEELSVALDLENKTPAYLCGRLFAVLELIQRNSSTSDLNRTIKDGYFAQASSKPAVAFPKLLRLSQNHLKKIKRDSAEGGKRTHRYYENLISQIMDDLTAFPKLLNLNEQGMFMIGYYHQNQELYKKSNGRSQADPKDQDVN